MKTLEFQGMFRLYKNLLEALFVFPNFVYNKKSVALRKESEKMAKKQQDNFLEYIPFINPANTYSEKENGNITVHMVNKGVWHKIAQAVFSTPKISHIDLDKYGSYVWKQIDGKRNVEEIGIRMKKEFGEAAEPLYPRLVQYLRILRNNKFVLFGKLEEK